MLRDKEHLTDQGILVTPEVGKLQFEEAVTALVDYHKMRRRETTKMEQRIAKHLTPYFGPKRLMATITGATLSAYVVKRQADVRVIPERTKKTRKGVVVIPERKKPTADATINRELAWLKQMFKLAIKHGKLMTMPTFEMLKEENARQGFLEPAQMVAVLGHLHKDVRAPIEFAYLTGWRLKSEVLSRKWGPHVDMKAGTVTLLKGEAKNREPRVFYFTPRLRQILEAQWAEHERLKKKGKIVPWVFHRGGEPIVTLTKAFKSACRKAGLPAANCRTTCAARPCVDLYDRAFPTAAMKLTGHKTRAVFDRYNIVSDVTCVQPQTFSAKPRRPARADQR